LAYAELKVNFVEGCAVLCLRRLNGWRRLKVSGFNVQRLRFLWLRRSMLRVSKKAECHAELVSASDSAFFVSGVQRI
jgi:hypothetical protein